MKWTRNAQVNQLITHAVFLIHDAIFFTIKQMKIVKLGKDRFMYVRVWTLTPYKMKKAYQQLSEDIGELKRQGALPYSHPSGSQASHAGKMRNKSSDRSRARNDYLGREYLGKGARYISHKYFNFAVSRVYRDVTQFAFVFFL